MFAESYTFVNLKSLYIVRFVVSNVAPAGVYDAILYM